ncbi:cupin domain-containing protein [Hydrogenobacter hydrogenophilus]|uniref:Cupin domain-containing protein n=1 Tax=Hydrogenobacter hydrogenophilus TaxID=35835 RepID=A0A285P8G8_9AQUI|nr:cupin domain-containing protein [Hydrogenobacter hydrogenophilus]SNZ16436.1 Cupin domain-containing protein [Hydrogenobacter hydrogenophilus]
MKNNLLKVQPNGSRLRHVLAYDSKEARVVVFSMPSGSEVPPHNSPSRVLLYCAKGEGKFLKGKDWIDVEEGDLVACEPLEPHGMKAQKDMIVIAIIAPAP